MLFFKVRNQFKNRYDLSMLYQCSIFMFYVGHSGPQNNSIIYLHTRPQNGDTTVSKIHKFYKIDHKSKLSSREINIKTTLLR